MNDHRFPIYTLRYRTEKNPNVHIYFVPVAETVDAETDEVLARYNGGRDAEGAPIAGVFYSYIVDQGVFYGTKNKVVEVEMLYGGSVQGTQADPFVSGGQPIKRWTPEDGETVLFVPPADLDHVIPVRKVVEAGPMSKPEVLAAEPEVPEADAADEADAGTDVGDEFDHEN